MAYAQKTTDWVITRAWIEAKAKGTPPAAGTPKYSVLLALVDTEQKNWEDEPDVEWDSRYAVVNSGTISTTDTYTLDPSIRYISKREGDYVYLKSADGTQVKPVRLVRPNQLYEHRLDSCYAAQIGRTLKFSQAFDASSQYIGYSLNVPGYTYCDDIVDGTTLIQCDRPMFLAYMVAASYARNDLVKVGQYQNILDKATQLMDKMKSENGGQEDTLNVISFVNGETWT